MRVTENRMLRLMSEANVATQSRVAEVSLQLGSGVAVDKPSDDPARWAAGMRDKIELELTADRKNTSERALERLDRVDSALGQVTTGLIRARELAVQTASDLYNSGSRGPAAVEVAGVYADILSSLNIRGPDGEYLLAGTSGDQPAFDTAGVYQGTDVRRSVETASGVQKVATVSGELLTATAGVDVLGTVDALRLALEADDPDAIRGLLDDLDFALEQASFARSHVGAASSALESSVYSLDSLEVQLTETLDRNVGTNAIEAATELANLSNQLETSRVVSERILALTSVGR